MKLKAKRDIKVKGHARVEKGATFEMTGPAAKYLVADGHAEIVGDEPAPGEPAETAATFKGPKAKK